MIYKLTKENLNRFELSDTQIEAILNLESVHFYRGFKGGDFYVNPEKGEIYTGKDFYFRGNEIEFPKNDLELIEDFFELKWTHYFNEQKKIAGKLKLNKRSLKERFKQLEIKEVETYIENLNTNQVRVKRPINRDIIPKYQFYLNWLKDQINFNSQFESDKSDSFKYFTLYFSEHSNLLSQKENLLFKHKELNVEYFKAIREYETEIKDVANSFLNEIRNLSIELETDKKLKLYLEQIQTQLNNVYKFIESKRNTPILKALTMDSSIVSVQNLIRDIAEKNKLEIIGDEIQLNRSTNLIAHNEPIDLNKWNQKGKDLFEYLIDNYTGAKGNQRFINIYHYLRNVDNHIKETDLKFFYGEMDYKDYIKTNYKAVLKKNNKPSNYQTQLKKMDEWYNRWLNKSKHL